MHLVITVFLFLFSISIFAKIPFDSTKNDRFSIHAQATVINQFKPKFKANYSGENSLSASKENKISITTTIFAGVRLWKGASIFINPELAGGSGLSGALGIADATNGETTKVGSPAPQIYLARFYYRQLFALDTQNTYQPRAENQLGEHLPNKYISFTIGKIAIGDYFDDNTYSHDPRTQFMS
ncbi:MAG TPA: carbohydrate porin, partial [Chitinophagales bacterium]|nr:carbohydrate porin [Chitinophagales bacterium]